MRKTRSSAHRSQIFAAKLAILVGAVDGSKKAAHQNRNATPFESNALSSNTSAGSLR